jgi:hypothetical protein
MRKTSEANEFVSITDTVKVSHMYTVLPHKIDNLAHVRSTSINRYPEDLSIKLCRRNVGLDDWCLKGDLMALGEKVLVPTTQDRITFTNSY